VKEERASKTFLESENMAADKLEELDKDKGLVDSPGFSWKNSGVRREFMLYS